MTMWIRGFLQAAVLWELRSHWIALHENPVSQEHCAHMISRTRMTSGVEALDRVLDGLYIGDNVVWHDDAGSLAAPFCHQFLSASVEEDKPIIYACFDRSPKTVIERLGPLADYEGLTILDCFTAGRGNSSPVFTKFYDNDSENYGCRIIKVDNPGDMGAFTEILYKTHVPGKDDARLVFESLTGMQELWGGEDALISFYSHSCPRLYELATIAYWVLEKRAHSSRTKASIGQVAQVVIDLSIKRGTTSLTVLKADDREHENLQKPYAYWTRENEVHFGADRGARGALDIGPRLKDLRGKQGISQTELARLVGVTPSTISQVESGLIYPSLPALLKMAEILRVEVSSLLGGKSDEKNLLVFTGQDASPVKIASMHPEAGQALRLIPVDFPGRAEPFLIEIQPGQTLDAHFFFHKGEECGYMLSGKLEARLNGDTKVVEEGQIIYLITDTPTGWQNHGEEPARILWFKIS